MTTRGYAITRHSARNRPLLDDLEFSAEVEALTLETERQTVRDTDRLLMEAIGAVVDGGALWLTALGNPVPRASRLAVHLARRDRLWADLERFGHVLPRGERHEGEIAGPEHELRYGGCIELATAGELPLALELTRCTSAVIFGRLRRCEERAWEYFLTRQVPEPKESRDLLRAAAARVAEDLFVVRSWFDDAAIGAEILAEGRILDRVEAALAASG
ncbi:hypothetical protein NDR87_03180 [Nocardia sp. CDC159]|uniref:Uncharacterized protein n=1 Tax=Nocardia pulmonis TaxID=2951408 RepID=A0A9X2IUE2_9NOCA|nr:MULTISPECIES: hypothetical protein [Nocardia]MCM6771983.1 hypothetical protein [Nocardia pulmonis]MCM6785359.1 hypothetical protein [Nocardia sp. CDC159]